jgi:hypothetical protein
VGNKRTLNRNPATLQHRDQRTREDELRSEDLPGALALGIDARDLAGEGLVATVLAHDASGTNGQLIAVAVESYGTLRDRHAPDVARLAVVGLTAAEHAEATSAALITLDVSLASELIELSTPGLCEYLRAVAQAAAEDAESTGDSDSADSAEAREPVDPETVVKAAASNLLDPFVHHAPLLERVAVAVLDADHVGARNAVDSYLPDLGGANGRVGLPELSHRLVSAAQRRTSESAARWLNIVDATNLQEEVARDSADALAAKAWKAAAKSDEDVPAYFADLLPAISRLLRYPLTMDSALAQEIEESLGAPTSDAEAVTDEIMLDRVEEFLSARVLSVL